jgi:hypothetical protein
MRLSCKNAWARLDAPGAILALVAGCHSFGSTNDVAGTSTTDAGASDAASSSGSVDSATPDASGFRCASEEIGVYCTTFDDPTKPYGSFVLDCPKGVSECLVVDGDRGSKVLALHTLTDNAIASLEVHPTVAAAQAKCELDWKLRSAPSGQRSYLVGFFETSGTGIASVEIDTVGRLTASVNEVPQGLPPTRNDWNHLVVTYGGGPTMHVTVNDAPAVEVSVPPKPFVTIMIGFPYEVPGWDLWLDDVRCEVQ